MSPKWLPLLGHVVVFCRCRRRRWHCGERLPGSSRRNFVAEMMTSHRNAVETSTVSTSMSQCQSQLCFWIAVIMMVLKWFQTPKYISTFAKWPPYSLLAAASWPANADIQWGNCGAIGQSVYLFQKECQTEPEARPDILLRMLPASLPPPVEWPVMQ